MLAQVFVLFLFISMRPSSQKHFHFSPSRTTPTRSPERISKAKCGKIMSEIPQQNRNLFSVSAPICVRLNDTQLFEKLRKEATYNPRYMAINETEACKNFNDLVLADTIPLSEQSLRLSIQAKNDQPQSAQLKSSVISDDANHFKVDAERFESWIESKRRQKRSLIENTMIGNCRKPSDVINRVTYLCKQCSAMTKLKSNIFPPYINEVICDVTQFCNNNTGKCIQRAITFDFLEDTGMFKRDPVISQELNIEVYIQDWKKIPHEIRSCCECGVLVKRR
ncbi:uncharacterized skeletal organic matrix protein 8-like [Stylophora pistillata]|nr:uncharacterized skeletal organic matrix protein 8-like [Stylophora pistillata]